MTKTCNHFSLLCLISFIALLNTGKTAISQSKTDKTEKMKIGGYIQALGFYGISKTGEPLKEFRAVSGNRVFSYNASAYADGKVIRIIPQAQWFTGKFSLISEYLWFKQKAAAGNEKSSDLINHAWTISLGYVLTMESGVNWYIAANTRLQLVYSLSKFRRNTAAAIPESESTITVHTNLAF